MKTRKLFMAGLVFSFMLTVNPGILNARSKKGNGNIVKREFPVNEFTDLNIDGFLNVHLLQDDDHSLTIEIDENLVNHLDIKQFGNKLQIGFDRDNIKPTKKDLYVSFKTLEKLVFRGVGNIECDNELVFEKLSISNLGVGNISLKGRAEEVTLKNSGVGGIYAFDFIVQKLDLDNSGVGSVKVYAEKELVIKNSGVGSVRYKGGAVITGLEHNGIGSVRSVN